ncbi:hypothetical protein PILCRDRAFT_824597 [Piloderma croceum F 1598]|uniref:Endoplasmic reticulum junction formation protein lunapark n=1 Tax=Piloderma croceum (strain F 1598) TaxID=765440 RepID=A0A0C3AWJ0_PILCF|nr:hypothetical protein PILCRDRAFT_829035 [Piloderma croceum F 1598]KIM78383.1 hypothetical protein PILCRDRAFT_824597 [Piloderma croceum F 1598]
MSFLFRWFRRKSDSEDYEQILSSLALDIQKRQSRLSDIRLRERRSTLLTTVYAFSIWALYVSLWYAGVLPNLSGHARKSGIEKAVKGAPVVVGPIFILFTRRIVQLWYTRIGDAEEKTLKALLRQQRTKIDEIKKKTNYYTTRNLLERYDEPPSAVGGGGAAASDPNSALRRRMPGGPPTTPQRQGQSSNPNPQTPVSKVPTHQQQLSISSTLQNQLAGTPQPFQPLRKQWYDKLADALLGDDESPVNAAASRYALICEKCFNHNGLVKESMWEDAQYVCPKCGHFNASANSKKSGSISTPTSPNPRSPTSPTAIPSHLRPNQGSSFLPSLGAPTGTQDSASRVQTRLMDEIEEGEDADADKEGASVMEVDS